MAPYSLSGVIQVPGSPETPNVFVKTLFIMFIKTKYLKPEDALHIKGVINVFSKECGNLRLLETWIIIACIFLGCFVMF